MSCFFFAQEGALEKIITIQLEFHWEIIASLCCVCVSVLLATADHFTTGGNEAGGQ